MLKMKSLHSFEASVIICQSTRRNIPEDSNVCVFSDHTPEENSMRKDIFVDDEVGNAVPTWFEARRLVWGYIVRE